MPDPFILTWFTLLLAPILAALFIYFGRRLGGRVTGPLLVAAFIYVAIAALGYKLNIGFTLANANAVVWCVFYFAYCLLAFGAGLLKVPQIRWPLQLLAMLPVAFGYFFATVGGLALAFIVGDTVGAPTLGQSTEHGLRCEIRPWGGGPADSGYSVDIYHEWTPSPLRRRLVRLQVDETAGDAPRNCADGFRALGQYRR